MERLLPVREVEHRRQTLLPAHTLKGVNAFVLLMAVDPLEALPTIVLGPQGGVVQINPVQISHEAVEIVVERILQQIPILLPLLVPLPDLGELVAHEVQLFARVGVHIHIERFDLGVLFIIFPRQLLEHAGLAVDRLVVGQRQQVGGVVVVHHGEGQLVISVGTPFRRCAEIVQGVVHPPHIPLVVEAQPALVHRRGHAGEGGGVLRRQDRRGVHPLQALVHVFEEVHRAAVDSPGRVPLPVYGPADGVHPQAVEVKLLQPVVCGGLEEAAHLPPGVHEVAAPPLAFTHGGVGVLIQIGAVVLGQGVAVHREVDGHEIHDDPDAVPVAGVDKSL